MHAVFQVGFARDGASYTRGLWERLNGADRADAVGKSSLDELPRAVSTRESRHATASRLSVEVEELEKKLQEMSKASPLSRPQMHSLIACASPGAVDPVKDFAKRGIPL